MTIVIERSLVQPVVHSIAQRKRRAGLTRPSELGLQLLQRRQQEQAHLTYAVAQASADIALDVPVKAEADVHGMSAWLDSLKWDAGGLVTVIAQVASASGIAEAPQLSKDLAFTVRIYLEGLLCSVAY